MNPCPCGYLGDPAGRCRCAPPEIARHRARISGPLLDRIDLRVSVPAVASEELLDEDSSVAIHLTTAVAAAQARVARERQLRRAGKLNVELAGRELRKYCGLTREARLLLMQMRAKFELSARGMHRVLRVARTIADLSGPPEAAPPACLEPAHVAEALQLRRAL